MWGHNKQIPELVRAGAKNLFNWVCLADDGHPEWPAMPNNRLSPDGTLGSDCKICFEVERHPTQERLRGLIRENFPWLHPSVCDRSAFGLVYADGGIPRFDIVLREDIRVVIEYQSEIHDTASEGRYGGEKGLRKRQKYDEEKKILCHNAIPKVKLIEVWHQNSKKCPVTWDGATVESLMEVFAYFNFDPYQYQ